MAGSLGEAKLAHDSVERWSRTEGVHWQFNYFLSRPAVRKEPKGVVAIIVPFNYPLWLLISPMVSAYPPFAHTSLILGRLVRLLLEMLL